MRERHGIDVVADDQARGRLVGELKVLKNPIDFGKCFTASS
jgi:hypothetical protein